MSYSSLFLKLFSSKEVHLCFERDESDDWTCSLWANTLEVHQQDFRATNVIAWEKCFTNKTVETYIFLSFMRYSLNIYLNSIFSQAVDKKVPPWMSGWNKNCAIKWKNNVFCKEYVRSGDSLFDSLTFLDMHIIVIVIIAISRSDHNSQ